MGHELCDILAYLFLIILLTYEDYEEAWYAQPTAWVTRIKSYIAASGLPLKIALTEVQPTLFSSRADFT